MSRLHRPDNLIRDKDREFLDDDGYYWFSFLCPSESRAAENHRHVFKVREDGAGAYCSCPYATNGGACTLMLCAPEIVRAALESESDPPPADPGGTSFTACERCAFEDVCREHGCAYTWPRAEPYAPEVTPDDVATARRLGSRLGPPADPGGAALATAQDDLDAEQGDWEMVEMSPEHPGGFWTATAYGPMHVAGDPHMSDETLGALREMAELAVRQHLSPAPNALDDEADAWEAELRRVRHDEGLRALYGN